MKVYMVTDGMYSDYRVVEIFSNLKEAEKYRAIHNYDDVEEMDVFDSCKQKLGETERWAFSENLGLRLEEVKYENRYDIRYFDYYGGRFQILVFIPANNYTMDEAYKIAKDYYAIAYNELMEANFPKDEKLLKMIEDKLNSKEVLKWSDKNCLIKF